MTWQPAALVFPDAEAVVCQGLTRLLRARGDNATHVDRERPADGTADRYVIVTRDGGATGVVRDRPRMRLRVFADGAEAATDLASLVVALMQLLVRDRDLLRAEHLSGPYQIADEGRLDQRYLLYEVHTRPIDQLT